MATPEKFVLSQLFVGLLYADPNLRDRAVEIIRSRFGDTSTSFGPIPFVFTDYYVPEMGQPMWREFIAFARLVNPAELSAIKLICNAIEVDIAFGSGFARPVNIDPGFVDRFKLVLASCKNGPMRVPLEDGVYAEVTMTWRKGGFQPHDLTYADYRSDEVRRFLSGLRDDYVKKLRETDAT